MAIGRGLAYWYNTCLVYVVSNIDKPCIYYELLLDTSDV